MLTVLTVQLFWAEKGIGYDGGGYSGGESLATV